MPKTVLRNENLLSLTKQDTLTFLCEDEEKAKERKIEENKKKINLRKMKYFYEK